MNNMIFIEISTVSVSVSLSLFLILWVRACLCLFHHILVSTEYFGPIFFQIDTFKKRTMFVYIVDNNTKITFTQPDTGGRGLQNRFGIALFAQMQF